jgi:hypothetical protein
MRKRKEEQWVCHEWPNCACGRASGYSTQPLHRYTTGAKDSFAIGDSFVNLSCMKNHAPDTDVRINALAQLMHPKYDSYNPKTRFRGRQ